MRKNLSHLSILCFGEVLFDELPSGYQPGGAPMNVAVHLANLGKKVGVISKVGNDKLGKEIINYLQNRKVDTQLIQVDNHKNTSIVKVKFQSLVEPIYTLQKDTAWDHIDLAYENYTLQPTFIVHGSLSCRYPNNYLFLRNFLKKTPSKVVFDLNLRAPYYEKKQIEEFMQTAHIIKMNEEEFSLVNKWMGMKASSFESKLIELKKKLPLAEVIIVTKGANGSVAIIGNEIIQVPRFEIKQIKDTVGSGDAFLAGFLSHYIDKKPAKQALEFASATGAFVATQVGANPDYKLENIIKWINKLD